MILCVFTTVIDQWNLKYITTFIFLVMRRCLFNEIFVAFSVRFFDRHSLFELWEISLSPWINRVLTSMLCRKTCKNIIKHPPPPAPSFCWGRLILLPNLQKWARGLTGSQFLEGGFWEWLFSERGFNFYLKNKLNTEIFNNEKSLQTKMFFAVTTKNLNCDILTKDLLLKGGMGLRMKNFNIMRGQEKLIYRG